MYQYTTGTTCLIINITWYRLTINYKPLSPLWAHQYGSDVLAIALLKPRNIAAFQNAFFLKWEKKICKEGKYISFLKFCYFESNMHARHLLRIINVYHILNKSFHTTVTNIQHLLGQWIRMIILLLLFKGMCQEFFLFLFLLYFFIFLLLNL